MILYEYKEFKEYLLNEIIDFMAFSFFSFLLYILFKKIEHTELIQLINKNFDNDYLTLEIQGKDIRTPGNISKLLMLRKKEISRILTSRGVILVFNKDAYDILRTAFQDIEFFKILSTGESIEYNIDDFIDKYGKYFGDFGEYRKEVNIEKIFRIFHRIDYNSLSEGAKLNLWWIGIVLRQIVKHGKNYGIEKLIFKAKKIQSVDLEK